MKILILLLLMVPVTNQLTPAGLLEVAKSLPKTVSTITASVAQVTANLTREIQTYQTCLVKEGLASSVPELTKYLSQLQETAKRYLQQLFDKFDNINVFNVTGLVKELGEAVSSTLGEIQTLAKKMISFVQETTRTSGKCGHESDLFTTNIELIKESVANLSEQIQTEINNLLAKLNE